MQFSRWCQTMYSKLVDILRVHILCYYVATSSARKQNFALGSKQSNLELKPLRTFLKQNDLVEEIP